MGAQSQQQDKWSKYKNDQYFTSRSPMAKAS